ncbi:hypothetical protein K491DRAFT_368676 [Lophiostoma macrostomum CBS 122681]|uniref:RBR-type E3 ubiquitin transferase n=1 Tax=Lophiostoma macrostomum CBS 122681 TaxID=1314788 RepID=A0A6A6TBS5_9PLEO|nr:hypothetical protein K491DRAFT_368676 [Lophiostoma macrostomum CBS 122681]
MPPKARPKTLGGAPTAGSGIAKVVRTLRSNTGTRMEGIVKEKPAPKKQSVVECKICASWRLEKYFKEPKDVKLCDHLRDTCKLCVEKMIKAQITDRALQDAVLACPFPNCTFVLNFKMVKDIVSAGVFENWDKALVKHYLGASKDFVACLDPECGHHFSVDLFRTECNRKKKIDCPYCSFNMCIKCSRPWHTGQGCSGAQAEEKASEKTIQKMGAKKCPSCGLNIQKDGGCDHIKCKNCNYNFCFVCLVQYTPTMHHAQGCRHGRQNIAQDAGNFWDGDLNLLGLLDLVPAQNGNVAGVGAQQPAAQPAARPAAQPEVQRIVQPAAQHGAQADPVLINLPNVVVQPRQPGQPLNFGVFDNIREWLGAGRINHR